MKLLANALVFAVSVGLIACTGSPNGETQPGGDSPTQQTDAPLATAKENAVETTASGLKYEILQTGDGASPSATSSVTVHYVGTLVDGTEFDSSIKRGAPATFPLNRVIPGWTEGLQLMQEGSKYRFTIPPDLGYGARGVPGTIPADSTLIFEVELISVN